MNDIDNLKVIYGLVIKPKLSTEEEHAAKLRERLRRERKEKLYPYSPESQRL